MLIKNKSEREAEIYISGDIVDDVEGDFLRNAWGADAGYEWPAKIREQLEGLKGKDITIFINSDGGMVNAGVAMANMIARHDGHTTAVVDGWCCSIATQIFFAADTRKIPENAYLMIHKPSVAVQGTADELLRAATALDTIQRGLESTYLKAAKEGITAADITNMVNQETWLTGKDAAEIFDVEVMGAEKVAACAGTKPLAFINMPACLPLSPAKEKPPDTEAEAETLKAKINLALALAD